MPICKTVVKTTKTRNTPTVVFLDASLTISYRVVVPDKQTRPLPVIHCLDLEKLEIVIKEIKKRSNEGGVELV